MSFWIKLIEMCAPFYPTHLIIDASPILIEDSDLDQISPYKKNREYPIVFSLD
jgi:hypothetical protein